MKDSGVARRVENATGEKFPKASIIQGLLSYATNTKKDVEDVIRDQFSADPDFIHGVEEIAKLYDKKKRAANSLDFDDMLLRTLELFSEHPQVLGSMSSSSSSSWWMNTRIRTPSRVM